MSHVLFAVEKMFSIRYSCGPLNLPTQDQRGGDLEHAGIGEAHWSTVLVDQYE